jgi:hypothetical protein
MAWKEIKYSKEFTWKNGDTRPTVDDGVTEGSIGYEIDETQPPEKQVTIYRFMQGDWRLL